MNQFEYLIPFVGLIYGLSATDLLISIHRLIIERGNVVFHPVPLVWAGVAFLMIINGWWGFFGINEAIQLDNAGQLLLLAVLPLLTFLFCAVALPHKISDSLNLWTYFSDHRKPFYLCLALYFTYIPLIAMVFDVGSLNEQTVSMLVLAGVFVLLIGLKHWLWHLAAALVLLISMINSLFNQSLVGA